MSSPPLVGSHATHPARLHLLRREPAEHVGYRMRLELERLRHLGPPVRSRVLLQVRQHPRRPLGERLLRAGQRRLLPLRLERPEKLALVQLAEIKRGDGHYAPAVGEPVARDGGPPSYPRAVVADENPLLHEIPPSWREPGPSLPRPPMQPGPRVDRAPRAPACTSARSRSAGSPGTGPAAPNAPGGSCDSGCRAAAPGTRRGSPRSARPASRRASRAHGKTRRS